MKCRVGNLKLYKFDAADETDVGIIIKSSEGARITERFKLSSFTGRGRGRGSKAGLSKSFVDKVDWTFKMGPEESNLPDQIFDYLVSNFSFKDLEIVPPSCPVLIFHVQTRRFGQVHAPENDITPLVLATLGKRHCVPYVPRVDDGTRPVPIEPLATEIVDCYQSSDLCHLCGKGYPKEDEIVHKTRCNHIFHGTCISRHLLQVPKCPICSALLPRGDIRTLLFS